jgi:excisionase family DNA binding protein
MKAEIKRLFFDYLELTEDRIAAANLVLADAILSGRLLSEPQSSDLSVSDAAEKLNCSTQTVYRLCENGKIPHYRLGAGRGVIRIRSADLAVCQQIYRSMTDEIIASKRRRYLGK